MESKENNKLNENQAHTNRIKELSKKGWTTFIVFLSVNAAIGIVGILGATKTISLHAAVEVVIGFLDFIFLVYILFNFNNVRYNIKEAIEALNNKTIDPEKRISAFLDSHELDTNTYYRVVSVLLLIVVWIILLLPIPCRDVKKASTKSNSSDSLYYSLAIKNVRYPTRKLIDSNLVEIREGTYEKIGDTSIIANGKKETYVLVATWKERVDFYKNEADGFYNTNTYPLYVFTEPEFYKRLKPFSKLENTMRLKQLLGLPPTNNYHYFVEFWVRPKDLFRSCADKEINDKRCELCLPNKEDIAHENFMVEEWDKRFIQDSLHKQYPWTQLGYTYDWNPYNETHRGLSEFVIGKNTKVKVRAIYTTEEFVKRENKIVLK